MGSFIHEILFLIIQLFNHHKFIYFHLWHQKPNKSIRPSKLLLPLKKPPSEENTESELTSDSSDHQPSKLPQSQSMPDQHLLLNFQASSISSQFWFIHSILKRQTSWWLKETHWLSLFTDWPTRFKSRRLSTRFTRWSPWASIPWSPQLELRRLTLDWDLKTKPSELPQRWVWFDRYLNSFISVFCIFLWLDFLINHESNLLTKRSCVKE